MQTRIKIIEHNDGHFKYICQRKEFDIGMFLFGLAVPVLGWFFCIHPNFIYQNMDKDLFQIAEFETMQEAKDFIDGQLKYVKESKEKYIASRIKKLSYLKYP